MTTGIVRRREIFADGKRLEVLEIAAAEPAAPTIVMLHEGLGSVALWKDFPGRLAERTGCAVVAYSRYGYGRSQPLAERRNVDYMHHEGTVVLPEILARSALEQPVLFGHSDGASIALIYAGNHPGGARALVLEAPHVFVEDLSVASIAQARTAFRTTDLPQRLARYHDDPDGAFYGWNDVWLDPRFRSWNIEAFLPAIRCPVLVIQGEQDEYGTAAQATAIRERVADTEVVMLPACGHSPHRDRAEATLEATARFLQRLAR